MSELVVGPLDRALPDERPVEVVERKGKGHPDTICDAVAEATSVALLRHYLDHFGAIQHHNVDKALLSAGVSEPRYGGGRVVEPMTLYLSGRATFEVDGRAVPVEELALETCRSWLQGNLHAVDPDRHVRIESLVRPGSRDLVELFRRQREHDRWFANDTSCGVGFAPSTELERVVLAVERELTAVHTVERLPAIGEDVKVMGVRRDDEIELTVACAAVDAHVPELAAYREVKGEVAEIARTSAAEISDRPVRVEVNAADDEDAGSVYLTVTGTSAEAGDDGQAGRGNRVGGLIAPGRPMVMESPAGKNPLSHTGKLYSVLAHRIARALVQEADGIAAAECLLVSRIGTPVDLPAVAEVRIRTRSGEEPRAHRPRIEAVVEERLETAGDLWRDVLEGEAQLF